MSDRLPDTASENETPVLQKVARGAQSIRYWVVLLGGVLLTLSSVTGPEIEWRIALVGLACIAVSALLLYRGRQS